MNWVEGPNPFGLMKPPDWWLVQLQFFDPLLFIMPSAQKPVYRLCRVAKHREHTIKHVANIDKSPDTQALARLSAVPVQSFAPTIQWTAEIFEYLMGADLWRAGGAQKAADKIEQAEQVQSEKADKAYSGEHDAVAGAAYRAFKSRAGQTVFVTDSTAT